MPVLQALLIVLMGAFLASNYCNILTTNARRDINKVVFAVFCPALIFASLAGTICSQGHNFLVVYAHQHRDCVRDREDSRMDSSKDLETTKPPRGNLGTLPLISIPAICNEDASPFGEPSICNSHGLSYASFSMAIANIYVWTHTYYIMKKSAILYKKFHRNDGLVKISSNNDSEITNVGREEE